MSTVAAEPTWTETRRTCLAYSPGGHLSELLRATAGIAFADCFHVTFKSGRLAWIIHQVLINRGQPGVPAVPSRGAEGAMIRGWRVAGDGA